MYRGSLQEFYWNKVTHENIDFVCPHFNAKIIKMRQYLSNVLKCDTLSDGTKVRIYHWLDSFKNLPTIYYYSNIIIQLFCS